MRTILFFTAIWLGLIISMLCFPFYFIILIFSAKLADKYVNILSTFWARLCIFFSGSKIEVEGLENIEKNKAYCVISNHQGYFDIPALMSVYPNIQGFVSKKEIAYLPIINFWMITLHCLFMDRKKLRKHHEVISKGVKTLQKDRSLIIFPEGTRAKDLKIKKFKPGSFRLAIDSGVDILPVTLNGTRAMLEMDKKIRKSNVKIIFGKPINTKEFDKTHELAKYTHDIVVENYNKIKD